MILLFVFSLQYRQQKCIIFQIQTVFAMLYKYTYCVFTLYGTYEVMDGSEIADKKDSEIADMSVN